MTMMMVRMTTMNLKKADETTNKEMDIIRAFEISVFESPFNLYFVTENLDNFESMCTNVLISNII